MMVRRFSPVSSGLCCRRIPNTRSAQPMYQLSSPGISHVHDGTARWRLQTDVVEDSRFLMLPYIQLPTKQAGTG